MNWNKFETQIREYLSDRGVPLWDYRLSKIGNLFVSLPEYHSGIDRERLVKEDVIVSIEFDNSTNQWTLIRLFERISTNKTKCLHSSKCMLAFI